MSLTRVSNGPINVANDNGVFSPKHLRETRFEKVTVQLAGRISLSYVSDCVFIITDSPRLRSTQRSLGT